MNRENEVMFRKVMQLVATDTGIKTYSNIQTWLLRIIKAAEENKDYKKSLLLENDRIWISQLINTYFFPKYDMAGISTNDAPIKITIDKRSGYSLCIVDSSESMIELNVGFDKDEHPSVAALDELKIYTMGELDLPYNK